MPAGRKSTTTPIETTVAAFAFSPLPSVLPAITEEVGRLVEATLNKLDDLIAMLSGLLLRPRGGRRRVHLHAHAPQVVFHPSDHPSSHQARRLTGPLERHLRDQFVMDWQDEPPTQGFDLRMDLDDGPLQPVGPRALDRGVERLAPDRAQAPLPGKGPRAIGRTFELTDPTFDRADLEVAAGALDL